MSFTVSTHFHCRLDRDTALAFFKAVDWQALGMSESDTPPTMLGGRRLLYKPDIRSELLIGFNTEQVTDTHLAVMAWLATRSGAMFNAPGVMHIDAKSISLATPSDQRMAYGVTKQWQVNEQGILNPASHQLLFDRILRRSENKQRHQVLEKLSEQWQVGVPAPQSPYQGKNPLFQSYPSTIRPRSA